MTSERPRIRDEATGLFLPDAYAEIIREAVPGYDDYQGAIGTRASGLEPVTRILDLGIGTGETSSRVLEHYPDALIVGVDESQAMLDEARSRLGASIESLTAGNFGLDVPAGPFDVVIASLAIHHLDHPGKQQLYREIFDLLRPGGRFVQGDIRSDGRDNVTFADNDIPAPANDMVEWMVAAGFVAQLTDEFHGEGEGPGDICIIVADRPG